MSLLEVSVEAFFQYCPEMLFVADGDGKLMRLSAALIEKLSPSVAVDTQFVDHVHQDDLATTVSALARIRETGEATRFDVRLRDALGEYVLFSCHARKDSNHNTIFGHLRELVVSIAEAGKASLKERLLDGIAQQMPLCLWAIDARGQFIYHDGAGLAAAGLKPNQFLGLNIFELYHGTEHLEPVKCALAGEVNHNYSSAHGVHWESWLIPIGDLHDPSSFIVLGMTLDVTTMVRAREELELKLDQIMKQEDVIRTLSTPIIEVWEGVVALPMVGLVDSSRTAELMDTLLQRIVENHALFAILDLTGVDVVDTHVANNLVKLINAIKLLGAEGIVSGLKPNVAQTIVTLGVDLSQIVTTRNLRAALALCIRRMKTEHRDR
jgi:rsbT co-antagonist protein RsbR